MIQEQEKWTPVIVKHKGLRFEKFTRRRYLISDRCRIRFRGLGGRILNGKSKTVKMNGAEFSRQRLCIASFHPELTPDKISEYHVGFIDDDPTNLTLSNLRWLSRSECQLKIRERTVPIGQSMM